MPYMTNRQRATATLAVALLLVPFAALAEGMPQMDFANPLTKSQVIWGTLIFIVLYLLLSRWALPQVGEVLEKRASTIAGDLDAARAAKSLSDNAVRELNEATRAARVTAQAEIAGAVAVAKDAAAAQAAELNARLEVQLAAAERQIGAARLSALGALRQVASETAVEVVSRLTGTAPSAQAVDRAVSAAMTARGQA